ncbi:FAD-dependent oxidoreductase [Novosphingobium sp. PASSN1]|uniref:FAD-dependent oxidoreductase n=1 Tax=Novosphingobium sp. PASSN1 TaxID=2015561 RepID=UPI000BDBBF44|nr:FAD-dependent oxidoreductase [Novosphingobium sp. PASSN1]OYU36243.1 MAG: FAD-dependent oxidoreductase [Novosphingobium sp. PASSN1]
MREFKTDVLVIGGGTAGFGAALGAARQGAKVRLIEGTSKIGGVMAFCPGMPWGGGYPTGRSIGGVFGELTDALLTMDPPMAEVRPSTLENFGYEVIYDHEAAVFAMFQMLEDAGVEVHLNTFAGAPVVDGGRITRVECTDRTGAMVIEAGMVIDCSGDGDTSARAGVPYVVGDGRGNMMGVTLSFSMVGADWARVFAKGDPYFEEEAAFGIAQGLLHPDLAQLYLMKGFHPDTVFCNSVHIRGVDGTDPRGLARATQEGRRRCHQLARFLTHHVPGFENARMSELGPTVGVRETRKLEAVQRILASDLRAGAKPADGIAACDNPIDDVMRGNEAMTHDAIVAQGDYYTIPFRAMVPERLKNLLFAGRLVCADPAAFASVRGMPQCMAMGQAAGTAAAMALAEGLAVQALDPARVVSTLAAQGVRGIGGDALARHAPALEPA